jgi:hypothetical protein
MADIKIVLKNDTRYDTASLVAWMEGYIAQIQLVTQRFTNIAYELDLFYGSPGATSIRLNESWRTQSKRLTLPMIENLSYSPMEQFAQAQSETINVPDTFYEELAVRIHQITSISRYQYLTRDHRNIMADALEAMQKSGLKIKINPKGTATKKDLARKKAKADIEINMDRQARLLGYRIHSLVFKSDQVLTHFMRTSRLLQRAEKLEMSDCQEAKGLREQRERILEALANIHSEIGELLAEQRK